MKPPFIRSPYNYDVKLASDEAMSVPVGPSLTIQSQSEDCDINVMMKRFGVTGKFPENPRVPSYGDFSQVSDFRSALAAVEAARDAFMEFPADFRAQFDNDPQNLLAFVCDDRNMEAARKLGLLKEPQNVSSVGAGSRQSSEGSAQGGSPPADVRGAPGGAQSGDQSGGQARQAGSASAVQGG